MWSLLLPQQVLLGEGPLQRVEVKDFSGSDKDPIPVVVLKTVWASFMQRFLTNLTGTAAI